MKNRLHRRTEARQAGFTLIEVLVALAIVAIALVAGSQATQALVRHGERQSDMLLAQICAENQLVAMRLSQVFPPFGDSEVSCPQAGVDLTVRITVMPTPRRWQVSYRRSRAGSIFTSMPAASITANVPSKAIGTTIEGITV